MCTFYLNDIFSIKINFLIYPGYHSKLQVVLNFMYVIVVKKVIVHLPRL